MPQLIEDLSQPKTLQPIDTNIVSKYLGLNKDIKQKKVRRWLLLVRASGNPYWWAPALILAGDGQC